MNVAKNSLLLIALICVMIALIFGFSSTNAQIGNSSNLSTEAKKGMAYFQGESRFENHGPSCLSCHTISGEGMAMGGTFAKDLTDVYSRLGDGLTVWLSAPTYGPMIASYQNNEITEEERRSLTAFLKHVNEFDNSQYQSSNGSYIFLISSLVGLLTLLGVFSLIWGGRKSEMVKQDIFNRSIKALDAKF